MTELIVALILLGAYSIIVTIVYYFTWSNKEDRVNKKVVVVNNKDTTELDLYKLQVERYKNEILELHNQLERCLKLLEK